MAKSVYKKQYPKSQAYLEGFGLDPGAITRDGLSPEGYQTLPNNPSTYRRADGGYGVTTEFAAWPAGFDYSEFQKCLWMDHYSNIEAEVRSETRHDH